MDEFTLAPIDRSGLGRTAYAFGGRRALLGGSHASIGQCLNLTGQGRNSGDRSSEPVHSIDKYNSQISNAV